MLTLLAHAGHDHGAGTIWLALATVIVMLVVGARRSARRRSLSKGDRPRGGRGQHQGSAWSDQ